VKDECVSTNCVGDHDPLQIDVSQGKLKLCFFFFQTISKGVDLHTGSGMFAFTEKTYALHQALELVI